MRLSSGIVGYTCVAKLTTLPNLYSFTSCLTFLFFSSVVQEATVAGVVEVVADTEEAVVGMEGVVVVVDTEEEEVVATTVVEARATLPLIR